jgi:hypothetical protein
MLIVMSDSKPAPAAPFTLIAEATKRAGLIWLQVPGGGRPRPAWHLWREGDGAAYLLTGPGEQPLPGLAHADRVTVLVPSKDTGALLLSWEAVVSEVTPGSPDWEAVIGPLAAARLNGGGDTAPGRRVYRLSPAS